MKDRATELLKIIICLAQIFWRWATPFWLFRDAQHGSWEQRVANYRYNRSQRAILPGYVLKWAGIAAVLLFLLHLQSGLLTYLMAGSAAHFCATLFCATTGIGFSFSCVVIAILTASYLYFTNVKD